MRILLITPFSLHDWTEVHGTVNMIEGIRMPNTRITSCGSEHAQKLIQAKSTHEYPIPHVFFVLHVTHIASSYFALKERSTHADRTIMRICEATANQIDRLRMNARKMQH